MSEPPSLPSDDFEREALRFLPDVLRFAKSLTPNADDAGDLVQDTYLRAVRARDTFKPDRGMRPWLFAICRHLFLRARSRDRWMVAMDDDPRQEVLGSVRLHIDAKHGAYEDVFDRLDFGSAFERAMAALPESYRVVVALVDVGDCSYAEVAESLGVPLGTVRSRLFRGRRELQAALIEHARDAGLVPAAPHTLPVMEAT